jgi:GntR family phosphonate transport system transcriptional regulator
MASKPIWREIHATLKREIAEGVYKTGDRLPTEKELSERFGVNRHTVRRALADLTAEGAIYVRRGSGAYVCQGVVDYKLGHAVRFSQNIEGLGRTPTQKLLGYEAQAADDRVAERLALTPNAPVIQLQTLGEADGLPIVYARRWFPAERFPGLADAFRETGSISAAMARFGVGEFHRAWTRILARAPSRRVAAILGQPDIQPVLHAEGVNVDADGRPVEYALADWAGGRAQFVVER